jgi:prolipoprotein diacylglyceryl transferase
VEKLNPPRQRVDDSPLPRHPEDAEGVAQDLIAKKYRTLTRSDILDILLIGFPCAIVGARLYYVVTVPARYIQDPLEVFNISNGGLGIMGGLIFGLTAAALVCRFKHIHISQLLWCVVPCIPLGQAIGRLGNWFNGELYGTETDLPWALDISRGKYEASTFYHPTFLYELLWDLLIFGVLMWIFRPSRAVKFTISSIVAPVYLVLYTIGRIAVESLRTDTSEYFLGLRINTWFAMFLLLGSLIWIAVARFRASRLGPER